MNTTALALIQRDELDTIQEAARVLALSNYFDGKGSTPQAIAQMATKILAGREMGFGPFASVNGIHIIQGRPSVGANLMAAAVKSSARYDYRVKEMTAERCVIEFFEREGDKRVSIGISEYTKEDGVKAGTQNLTKFPRNMLFARAMSNGVRWYCPDVFSGNAVYTPEELGATVDEEGNVIEVEARRVDPELARAAEIMSRPHNLEGDLRHNAPTTAQTAQTAIDGASGQSNPFDDATPFYVRDWQQLTGAQYDLVDWIRQLHRKQCGPCSVAQYGYVTGIMDELTSGQHGYILALLCQAEIGKENKPSKDAASALLKFLAKTIKVKNEQGNEVDAPNPQYRQDMADMVTAMAQQAVEA